MSLKLRRLACVSAVVCFFAVFISATAFASDLQVTDYSPSSDPVANGADAVFTIQVDNNDTTPVSNAVVTINISPKFTVGAPTNYPGYCVLNGVVGSQTLTCSLPAPLTQGIANAQTFSYTAKASAPGSANTVATISASGNADVNPRNDSLTITPSVKSGADLSVTNSPSAVSIPAGSALNYTLTAHNAGPNTTAAVRITETLPATADYQYQSSSGTGWSCSVAGTVVTCDYSGTAPAVGSDYPPVTINGTAVSAVAGNISSIASVKITDPLVLDPNVNNNTSPLATTAITAGSDLQPIKSMPGTIVIGTSATITLSIKNNGPQNVPTGTNIRDTIDASLTVGAMPSGCSLSGRTVTCSTTALSIGQQVDFLIPVTGASVTAGTLTNSAVLTPPSGYTDSNLANNTATAPFQVLPANADLALQSKIKAPSPVQDGANVTSAITVVNNGPSVATYDVTHPIRVTDTLDPNETFVSNSAGWSCVTVGSVVTCQTTTSGTLAKDSTIGLSLITKPVPGTDANIANTACTDRTAGSGHTPSDASSPTGNDCASASVRSTTQSADLTLTKEVSLSSSGPWTGNLTIADTDQSFYVRLVARNLSGNTARTVTVTDVLPNAIDDGSNITAVTNNSISTGTAVYDAASGTATWSLANLAVGTPQTLILKITRPFGDGSFTNIASIFSSDTTETNAANNSASASYTTAAVADVTLTDKTITPNPAQVGVSAIYVISAKNIGGNQAVGIKVNDTIDPTRFDIVGTPTVTGGGSCVVNTGNAVVCSLGSLARNESQQVSIVVLPKYPFGGHSSLSDFPVSHTNHATITTTTKESDTTNNSIDLIHNVIAPNLDLVVTKVETPLSVPGATGDPITYGQTIEYDVRISNNGPSRATNILLTDFPTPPTGLTTTLISTVANPAGSSANSGYTFQPAANATCVAAGANYSCKIDPATIGNNYLDAGKQVLFRMVFSLTGSAPSLTTTNTNTATITSAEQPTLAGAGADPQTANNTVTQNTTVQPSTDLAVLSKIRTGALVRDINEPIEYTISVVNNGPSSTTQVRVSDALPAGFIYTATPAPSYALPVGSTATVSALNCSGTTTILCILGGTFPGDANSKVDLKVNMRTADPYTGSFTPTDSTNAASIAPGLDVGGTPLSVDPVSANNQASANVQIYNGSIAGTVYSDNNRNDTIDSGEGINAVTLTLTGSDIFGNAISRTITTTSDGSYKFDHLPPSDSTGYTIVETQPGGYFDRNETAGTSGGIVNNTLYGSAVAQNTISKIVLASKTNATGYVFQEYQQAQVSGYIYRDLNNDGVRDAGETGYAPAAFATTPHIRLTGNDYAGVAVNLTTSVDANGFYSFGSVPPSNTYGYIVTELVQPTGASDGKDSNGVGAVVPNSSGRGSPEDIIVGKVDPNANLTERNFGELPTSSLSGIVYFDGNKNAIHDATETSGLASAIIKLSGTNDIGDVLNCSITTDATGTYSFPKTSDADPKCLVLRPGTYTITETPPPGLSHTGVYIGSSGGSSAGITATNTPVLGSTNIVISAITVPAGTVASNYNFGESGQGLTGTVYIDGNNSGARDATEVGIPGISITLSGTTATGQDVCGIIACVATTDSAGNYSYLNLPGSNATGYTITEQAQTTAPLSNFADGQDKAGGLSGSPRGTAGNDVVSGVVIGSGELLTNYQFGEIASSLAGRVYIDNNDNGTVDTSEIGIGSVQITLSGNTKDGQNVCTYLAALTPARSCTTTTATDGSYSFDTLPAGTYTLIETQPSIYATGKETAGTSGGTTTTNKIDVITLAPGIASTGNLFGEHAVSIGGYVFKDPQRDGVDSGSEPRLAGVVIILHDQSGAEIARATTGADGSYSFNNLPAGSYTIEEVQPAGYGSSTPKTVAVTVTAGGAQQIKFGNTVSTLAGNVFVDSSNDGIRQSPTERGIAAVTLTLSGTDAAGHAVTRTVTTAADGTYKVDDLLAGTYTLTETQPTNYVNGINHQGSAGGTVGSNVISAIALPIATDATAYDFGERGQGLSGVVYDDRNRNGVKDATDPAISGVTVELRQNGALIATTVTGVDGRYSFPDIEAGMYDVVEVQPNGYSNAPENNSNTNHFTVVAGTQIADVNFGELTGSIAGSVYNDSNGNGQRDANEPAIPNTIITLSGTTARGENVCAYLAGLTPAGTCSQSTANDGSYTFVGLPDGTYTLNETQPTGFGQGINTTGTSGGGVAADQISSIALTNSADATGYLFGEKGASGQISGTVWFDANHDRIRESAEQVESGWTVQLLLGNTLVSSTTTDSKGGYGFANIAPGTGYRIHFVAPNGAAMSGARTNEDNSTANPGKALIANGEITNITLTPGGTVPQQSLPLDPSGVVYDSVRRTAVQNATVTINGPSGFDAATQLLGGLANQAQKTGADGMYQFLLLPGAPNGTYTLSVTPPSGSYNPTQPSTIVPPCTGPYTVGSSPDPMLISLIDGAPPLGTATTCGVNTASTTYFLSLTFTAGVSAQIVNNNIPIDPILKGAIVVTKTTPLVNVTRGQLVPYTITARNTLNGTLTGITISDTMPAGFQYRINSARVNNVPLEPTRIGRVLAWPNQNFLAQASTKIDLLLTVGAGVKEGNHVNQAYAINAIVDTVVSNIAEATVRIIPDADFDCTDIIGKVFDDKNNNGIQDNDEPGLPGVRLATVNGLLVTTDQFGRYHITCPMIANEDRGSNFILKLDTRTLPTGYRLTTENPETVRLTRGKFVKLNFGATLNHVVRLDVTAALFDKNDVIGSYKAQMTKLVATLAEKPSVLRVVYAQANEGRDIAKARMNALVDAIRRCWKQDGDRYRLTIEQEITTPESHVEGGVQ